MAGVCALDLIGGEGTNGVDGFQFEIGSIVGCCADFGLDLCPFVCGFFYHTHDLDWVLFCIGFLGKWCFSDDDNDDEQR